MTRSLRDLETVQVGEIEVRAYHMPGHSSGSAAYLVNGLLFLGDEANASSDGKLEGTRWVVSEDVGQADASLVRLEQQLRQENADVDAIVFAHSGVLTEASHRSPLLPKTIDRFSCRVKDTKRAPIAGRSFVVSSMRY